MQKMQTEEHTHLADRGWTTFSSPDSQPLVDIAKAFGEPVPPRPDRAPTRILKPLSEQEAEPGSLSALRGRGRFPYHTDCAYYRRPPNLIFFRAVRPTPVATLMIDGITVLRPIENLASTAIFRARGLRKRFLCRMVSNKALRWDPDCMDPVDDSAYEAAKLLVEISLGVEPIRFSWNDNSTVLVVDNRRILHGREDASADPNRELESVLIYSN